MVTRQLHLIDSYTVDKVYCSVTIVFFCQFFLSLTFFQVNSYPNGQVPAAKFNDSATCDRSMAYYIYGGDNNTQSNQIMQHSNVTFAEHASFNINSNDNTSNQTSNIHNTKDKNFFNSDNTSSSSVDAGDLISSKLLYHLCDFDVAPSKDSLKLKAYSVFEKYAATLPSSADLIPPGDDSDEYSEIEADDPENPYQGIFK